MREDIRAGWGQQDSRTRSGRWEAAEGLWGRGLWGQAPSV